MARILVKCAPALLLMTDRSPQNLTSSQFQELVGYLNFSSGMPDPHFLGNLNRLFAAVAVSPHEGDTWPEVCARLAEVVERLAASEPAFRDAEQARQVLRHAGTVLPPAYRQFHRDLLLHQRNETLWLPFFAGRAIEAVLRQGSPWDEDERIVAGAIETLNDFIGHRPVAVLRTAQKIEPYAHEWVRPVPLFIRGAGVSTGPYEGIVTLALEILQATDPALLRRAWFDPALLDELAFDPRAYDFEHPANKRPNYHFGQWDPHLIDQQGFYRRFVVQQVTLDVLLERVADGSESARDDLLVEAAAVLAGTMLMASGTSGNGPEAHDSTTTLSTLLPEIAAYRDAFYSQFIARMTGPHGERLRAEAHQRKQPLAGARQLLNQQLARRRASQLEHVHLALLFARMGYSRAAMRQAEVVPVASARMICEMQCRLSTARLAIGRGRLEQASVWLTEVEDFLHRAIQCGALADPWNMLGFQGQFSLFPAPENSVPDHRLEQLSELLEQLVGLYARLWSAAAAADDGALQEALSARLERLTTWWDQYASTSVEGVEGFSGAEAFESAREVAGALAAFHQAGAAAGDVGFWRKRVSQFNSPKAYALVVATLIQQPDAVAAMALLMQWLSQLGMIALKQGEYSFHTLAQRWLARVLSSATEMPPDDRRALVVRFFELLEANAEDAWHVPRLELLGSSGAARQEALDENELDEEDAGDELFRAAYDDVVYIDSTADGTDADMLESGPGPATDFELEHEARRVSEQLSLLQTVALLWKRAALALGPNSDGPLDEETLEHWLRQANANQQGLVRLLRSVSECRLPTPANNRDALLEFDRRRAIKESLTERIVLAAIDVADAARIMQAALPSDAQRAEASVTIDVLRAIVREDAGTVVVRWDELSAHLEQQTLLYVPVSKGGDPGRLVQARALQQLLRDLLQWLPKLGLLRETCQLLEAARLMESLHPVGPGAISEYDRLFIAGYESLVEAVVEISSAEPGEGPEANRRDARLVEILEHMTESLLKQWLAHSRTLRLSVLERIADDRGWNALVAFIERYGGDIFSQQFLNLGNLRAILHQGVDVWLERLAENPPAEGEPGARLIAALDGKLSRADAVKHLGLIIEAVAENYAEYRDYNSTTTQSDRGDMIYTLLDFLRLRVHYDRIAWHLKPVFVAHSVLVRRGRRGAAELWRDALAERTSELADSLEAKGVELRAKYAMRLPTVTDRLAERFVQPLLIDRLQALIRPAMEAVREGESPSSGNAFSQLEREATELAEEPTGVGLEVPQWLASLEQEASEQLQAAGFLAQPAPVQVRLKQVLLSRDQVEQQFESWERHPH